MSGPNPFASAVIRSAAGAVSGYVASALAEKHPKVVEETGFDHWRMQVRRHVIDLADAVEIGSPSVFASQVDWVRQAFQSRSMPVNHLRVAIDLLASVLTDELPPNAVGEASRYMQAAQSRLDEPSQKKDPSLAPDDEQQKLALTYILRILEGDRRAAIRCIVEAVAHGLDIRDAYLKVLLPAQVEIGRMWHVDELSIGEEHFATETTRSVMSILASSVEGAPPNGKTCLVSGVAGNLHDIGVRCLADLFELDGWRAVCLGGDVPPDEIAVSAEGFKADVVMLSAAMPGQFKSVKESIEALRESDVGSHVKVLVGGLAFEDEPELWRQMGADGYAENVEGALRLAAELST